MGISDLLIRTHDKNPMGVLDEIKFREFVGSVWDSTLKGMNPRSDISAITDRIGKNNAIIKQLKDSLDK